MLKQVLLQAGFFFLATTALLGLFSWSISRSERYLRSWPSSQGRVLTSGIKREFRPSTTANVNNQLQEFWVPEVSYTYQVAGHAYVGTRISNTDPTESLFAHAQPSDAMRRFVARYAVGQDVMVWYEPSDPRRSYLQINFASGRIMRWAVASLVLCGASLIGYALR